MKPIIILLLIFFGVKLLRKSLTKKIASKAPSQREEVAGKQHAGGEEMVLDPVCKSYVPITSAILLKTGGRVEYFCSDECREKYEKIL